MNEVQLLVLKGRHIIPDFSGVGYMNGEVAWFSDISNWKFKIHDNSMKLNNVRITGVLEKRKGRWKIVQVHASAHQCQITVYE